MCLDTCTPFAVALRVIFCVARCVAYEKASVCLCAHGRGIRTALIIHSYMVAESEPPYISTHVHGRGIRTACGGRFHYPSWDKAGPTHANNIFSVGFSRVPRLFSWDLLRTELPAFRERPVNICFYCRFAFGVSWYFSDAPLAAGSAWGYHL